MQRGWVGADEDDARCTTDRGAFDRDVSCRGVVMITPTDDLREVLEQGVQWNPLLTSRLVTDEDLQAIQRYDTRDEDARADLMDEVRKQNRIRYLMNPRRASFPRPKDGGSRGRPN